MQSDVYNGLFLQTVKILYTGILKGKKEMYPGSFSLGEKNFEKKENAIKERHLKKRNTKLEFQISRLQVFWLNIPDKQEFV